MGIQFTQEVAEWYDAYRTHFYDYKLDAEVAAEIIKTYRPGARRILEVGVGTANLAIELARLGFDVDAVDNSPFMLKIAREKIDRERRRVSQRIKLSSRRCENMNLDNSNLRPPYDAVVSHGLFLFIGQRNGLAFASYILDIGGNRAAFRRINKYLEDPPEGQTNPQNNGGGVLLINTLKDYQPERRSREPLDLKEGGTWHVDVEMKPYGRNGVATLRTTYNHETAGGRQRTYPFEKSVFPREAIEADLRTAGFEIREPELDRTGNRGFYVAQKKSQAA